MLSRSLIIFLFIIMIFQIMECKLVSTYFRDDQTTGCSCTSGPTSNQQPDSKMCIESMPSQFQISGDLANGFNVNLEGFELVNLITPSNDTVGTVIFIPKTGPLTLPGLSLVVDYQPGTGGVATVANVKRTYVQDLSNQEICGLMAYNGSARLLGGLILLVFGVFSLL